MMQLEDYLRQHAESHPTKAAILCDDECITYEALWNQVVMRAKGYRQESNHAVVIRCSQTIPFLMEYFACHLAGKVFVPLESDCKEERFQTIQQEIRSCQIPQNVADILYTTGTTGQQKGIMISHKAIIANAENLIDAMQFSHELLFIISGPLNHIGSLSKIWPTIIMGATLCITSGMKDMNKFLGTFSLPYPRIATFLVPSSIRMLLQFASKRLPSLSPKIDFIETGAAPMSQADMEALCQMLPHSRLYNTYASTETGIICTHNYNSDYCVAGCLGRHMKHSSVFITAEGNVACKGDTLMEGYVGAPSLTASIMRDNTIFTSDCGRIDKQGRLHLTGRSDDIINIGGYKVNPVEVEDAALSFPTIADCICATSAHPILGMVLKLYLVLKDDAPLDKKELSNFLFKKLERYKVPQLFSIVDHIERTYNGKLNRKFYMQT